MKNLNGHHEIKQFIDHNFRHFNAASLKDAAQSYASHIKSGNHMLITLAGAMSTAELGVSLAEMIRQDKVHAICSTGANIEEDIFNLVAHEHYRRIPNWRSLSEDDEMALLRQGLNRVTDVCIPEEEAMRKIESRMLNLWQKADRNNERKFPYEFFYELLSDSSFASCYQADPKNSWVIAAKEKNIPIFTPGYEDSTLANMFVSHVIKKNIKNIHVIKNGMEQMLALVHWYKEKTAHKSLGFFQIGGGIAGDFPICVVPLIAQDLGEHSVKCWSYFCQISDSTSSYGSYSGAFPSEKITWGKINKESAKFIIESDASIVAPLIFAYVLAS
jgi:deoxyhypusine synthase